VVSGSAFLPVNTKKIDHGRKIRQEKIYEQEAQRVRDGMVSLRADRLSGVFQFMLHRQDVSTVYVEMFDADSFRRGYEFTLTDAICKRIEAQTPYKIVSDRNVADTVLSGSMSVGIGTLAGERWTGRPLEQETMIAVNVTWKNLKTGQVLVDGKTIYGSASYSSQLGQTIDYSVDRAVNKVAQKVVELMEQPW
jgi:hypothetical protein